MAAPPGGGSKSISGVGRAERPSATEGSVIDGLYSLAIEMSGRRAAGIVILQSGRIMGGDSFFY